MTYDGWHEEHDSARHEIEERVISSNAPYEYMDSTGIDFGIGTTESSWFRPFKIDHLLDKCTLTQYLGFMLDRRMGSINRLGLTAPESSSEKAVGFS